ncbi:MAG: hypothetical protein JXA49_08680 [Actinobacteria bacterium]|nr:hypothetical protein [Actinomycetota bacterium]
MVRIIENWMQLRAEFKEGEFSRMQLLEFKDALSRIPEEYDDCSLEKRLLVRKDEDNISTISDMHYHKNKKRLVNYRFETTGDEDRLLNIQVYEKKLIK